MRWLWSVGIALTALALVGCSESSPIQAAEPSISWQEAKAAAQEMEMQIAALVPSGDVADVHQNEVGGLFSCDGTRHRWKGITTVKLVPGSDADTVAKRMERRLRDAGDFEVTNYRDITDSYVVVLQSPKTGEGYLFGEGEPGTIVIDSWSVCFTLPEGTYPGGDF